MNFYFHTILFSFAISIFYAIVGVFIISLYSFRHFWKYIVLGMYKLKLQDNSMLFWLSINLMKKVSVGEAALHKLICQDTRDSEIDRIFLK